MKRKDIKREGRWKGKKLRVENIKKRIIERRRH